MKWFVVWLSHWGDQPCSTTEEKSIRIICNNKGNRTG